MGLPQVTLLGAGWGTISDASLVFLARPRPLPFLLRAGADAVTAEPTPNHHIHTYLMIISHLLHRCGQTTSPGNQTLREFHRPEVTSLWICDHNKKKLKKNKNHPNSPALHWDSCVFAKSECELVCAWSLLSKLMGSLSGDTDRKNARMNFTFKDNQWDKLKPLILKENSTLKHWNIGHVLIH